MDTPALHALVEKFSGKLGIRTPRVKIVDASLGASYRLLSHTLQIDEQSLALSKEATSVIVAHELGHARQRRAAFRQLAISLVGLAGVVLLPLFLATLLPLGSIARAAIGLAGLLVLRRVFLAVWGPRVSQEELAFELDADSVAASLCGARATLITLENYVEAYGDFLWSEERLEALRERVQNGVATGDGKG
jgi:Zn-dependent protease with chaperone function